MYSTVFLAAAIGPYQKFALPFIYSALHHNPDICVELLVEDADGLQERFGQALRLIQGRVGDRFLLRNASSARPGDAPYLRFLETPQLLSRYVYISDVDILILDRNITEWHVANSKKLGLPYSNSMRPGGERLTGLHFTLREAYYPVPDVPRANWRGDEVLLKQLVEMRGYGLPPEGPRPLHGIHMSPNRASIVQKPGSLSWGLNRRWWDRYVSFASESCWRQLLPVLDAEYQSLIEALEKAGGENWG